MQFATALCDRCGTTERMRVPGEKRVAGFRRQFITTWQAASTVLGRSSAVSVLGAFGGDGDVLVLGVPFFRLELRVLEVSRIEMRAAWTQYDKH